MLVAGKLSPGWPRPHPAHGLGVCAKQRACRDVHTSSVDVHGRLLLVTRAQTSSARSRPLLCLGLASCVSNRSHDSEACGDSTLVSRLS